MELVRNPGEPPLIAVVVLNFNGLHDTVECLDSLAEQDFANIIPIVIDNKSTSDELSTIRNHKCKPICVQNDSNLGFARASNEGIELATSLGAEFILLLNNDTVLDRHSISSLASVMVTHASIGLAGPKICYYSARDYINTAGGSIFWSLGWIHDVGLNRRDGPRFDSLETRDWISGCAMMIRCSVFAKVGLLDWRNFPQGGEDYDFSVRARRSGYLVAYCPASIIWHKVSRTRLRIGAKRITISNSQYNVMLKLLSKHFKSQRCERTLAYLLYRTIFSGLGVLSYIFLTPDRQLRRYYCARVVARAQLIFESSKGGLGRILFSKGNS